MMRLKKYIYIWDLAEMMLNRDEEKRVDIMKNDYL